MCPCSVNVWSAGRRIADNRTGRITAKRIVAANRKAHVAEPYRPQPNCRFCKHHNDLFDIFFNASSWSKLQEQHSAIAWNILCPVNHFPQRSAVDAPESDNRSSRYGNDEPCHLVGRQGRSCLSRNTWIRSRSDGSFFTDIELRHINRARSLVLTMDRPTFNARRSSSAHILTASADAY